MILHYADNMPAVVCEQA